MNKIYTNVCSFGSNLLVREIENGVSKKYKVKFKPELFLETNKKTNYTTISGRSVERVEFDSMKEAKEFISSYSDVSNFKIYGNENFVIQYISKYYNNNLSVGLDELNCLFIDIETECEDGFPSPDLANQPINLITIKRFGKNNKFITYGCGEYTPKEGEVYYKCDSEEELLQRFLFDYTNNYPDILVGWNNASFDVVYIVNRICLILGEDEAKRLSPWNYIRAKNVKLENDREEIQYSISGVAILDYMLLYKKNIKTPRDTYKLDYICEVELKSKKLDYSEYSSLKEFYKKNWQKFTSYNIQDVNLLEELENKLGLLKLTVNTAYFAKVNYEDVSSQVRTWDSIIYNYLREKNIVIPQKQEVEAVEFEGAFVKEPIPGLYYWVVSLDVAGLYPSLIRLLNIGVETKIKRFKDFSISKLELYVDNEHSLSSIGVQYSKTKKSFFSELAEKLINDRKVHKKIALDSKQKLDNKLYNTEFERKELIKTQAENSVTEKVLKILNNSLYGAMGNRYFRYYDIDNAESITKTGQFVINYIMNGLNTYLNNILKTNNIDYIIAVDTDSNYVNLKYLVDKFPDKIKKDDILITKTLSTFVAEKLEPEIDRLFAELNKIYLNGMDSNLLKMKREVIANKAIWTSKKHYVLNVYDNEGVTHYDNPEMKVLGLEMKKSSIPEFCRNAMKEGTKIILNSDQETLIKFIEKIKKEFMSKSPEEISLIKGINGLTKYKLSNNVFTLKSPFHVKGAIIYNKMLRETDLLYKYELIKEGERIRYIHLVPHNPTPDKVFAFPASGKIPDEFNIKKYIDWNKQFEKTFLEPFKIILDAINWTTEHVETLDSFIEEE